MRSTVLPPMSLCKSPEVSADAVLDVDDVVADFERAQVLEECLGGAFRPPFGAMSAAAEDFFFGDEDEAFGGCDDAARERSHDDADLGAPAQHRAPSDRTVLRRAST